MTKPKNFKLKDFSYTRKRAAKVISLEKFTDGKGLKMYDESTKKSFLWLLKIAKESDVDVTSEKELKAFAEYLKIGIMQSIFLLEKMISYEVHVDQLELSNPGIMIEGKGETN